MDWLNGKYCRERMVLPCNDWVLFPSTKSGIMATTITQIRGTNEPPLIAGDMSVPETSHGRANSSTATKN